MVNNNLFDLTSIHQRYWKDFCDVCYSRFGFEQGEVRTYEQKYETFCRCKNYVTSEEGYEEQLLMTKEEDLKRLQSYAEWFFGIDDAYDILPALYNLVRMLWTIRRNLKSDMQLIKYFCPRRPKVNYSDYKLELKKIPDCIRNNKTIREVLRSEIDATLLQAIMGEDDFFYQTMDMPIKSELLDGTPFVYNNADGLIVGMVNYILDEYVHWYNTELNDFVESLPDGCECARGSEIQAFIYRLFMSYGQSLREIKELVEEYPAPRNLEVLKGEYERLVEEFEETRLGEHWIECIEEKEGLQHIAKFFMHKRKRITEEEEQTFFYTLDKICIISDILNGKADKYWLEVEYPDGWEVDNDELDLEQRQKAEPSTPNPIVDAIREQTEVIRENCEELRKVVNISNTTATEKRDDSTTEHLDNIIFNPRVFDSDARLTDLRNTIASFIDLGEDNNKLSVAAENQIEPTAQNEWYYILIAIAEAEIVGRNVFSDVNFAIQMISWFPWLFHFDTPEEMATFKRKFTKSISAERSLWKYGAKKEVTAIKDMWARQRTLGIDYAKLSRLHPVANGLKKALEELKTEIQKAQSAKR